MIENDPQWKWPDQWTPAHHWYMRAEEISYTRHRQQARLAFWRDRQRQSCEWICLADIADWCAMGSTSLARDEERRIQASADLLQAVRRGEFNRRGRLCVAYIPPWHFVCPDLDQIPSGCQFDPLAGAGRFPGLSLGATRSVRPMVRGEAEHHADARINSDPGSLAGRLLGCSRSGKGGSRRATLPARVSETEPEQPRSTAVDARPRCELARRQNCAT